MDFFKLKVTSFLIAGFLPFTLFFIGLFGFEDLLLGTILGLVGAVAGAMVGLLTLRHPLLGVIEGKGLGVLGIDSTGIIKIYLAKVQTPNIFLRIGKGRFAKNYSTHYDASLSASMHNPEEFEYKDEEGKLKIELPKEDFKKKMFKYGNYTFLLWNDAVQSFISKEWLAKAENTLVVDHVIMHTAKKIEDLSGHLRDFARYIVEQTRPKQGLLAGLAGGWLFWVIIVVFVIVIAFLFGPQLLQYGTRESSELPISALGGLAIPYAKDRWF